MTIIGADMGVRHLWPLSGAPHSYRTWEHTWLYLHFDTFRLKMKFYTAQITFYEIQRGTLWIEMSGH